MLSHLKIRSTQGKRYKNVFLGEAACDRGTGKCECKENVEGHNCDKCKKTYWNIDSGAGCDPCNCDPIGSLSQSCDLRTGNRHLDTLLNHVNIKYVYLTFCCLGRCKCSPGITGHRCDVCMTHHFGFSQVRLRNFCVTWIVDGQFSSHSSQIGLNFQDGCKTCDCDARGSRDATCNQLTGQCTCITDKVEGRRCDRWETCWDKNKNYYVVRNVR